jgi:hypothetical protein
VPDSPAPFKRLTINEWCGPSNGRPANNIGSPAKSSERKLGVTFFLHGKSNSKPPQIAITITRHGPATTRFRERGNQQFDRLR